MPEEEFALTAYTRKSPFEIFLNNFSSTVTAKLINLIGLNVAKEFKVYSLNCNTWTVIRNH
jgi:hypothetical protein